MARCSAVATPTSSKASLVRPASEEAAKLNSVPLRELAGHLLPLATRAWPDLPASAGHTSRHASAPGPARWAAPKRALRHLKSASALGLMLCSAGSSPLPPLPVAAKARIKPVACVWMRRAADDMEPRRAASGCALLLGEGASAGGRGDSTPLGLSDAEAEHMALCEAGKAAAWA